MQVLSVGLSHPPYYHSQDEILNRLQQHWNSSPREADKLARFFASTTVEGRHASLTLDEYAALEDFGDSNDVYITVGIEIAEQAIQRALDKASIVASDVDAIFTTTVTGIAVPTIDARLIQKMGFRDDVKRTPLFGLGCVAGAAGIARMNDYLQGDSNGVTLLLALELCSLTFQDKDYSVPNLVGSALFGDGCAAVVAVGNTSEHSKETKDLAGPKILSSKSRIYPNSERLMGWDISASGFKIVLSSGVPDIVKQYVADDIDSFLSEQHLQRSDISSWVCHPGGPKVIDALIESLDLKEYDLALTRESLRTVGNMSSVSVLSVLCDTIETRRPQTDEKGIMLAMGPGFVSEFVLLEW